MGPVDPVDSKEARDPKNILGSTSEPDAAPQEPSPMDRRRFMGVLAIGGAAVLAGSVPRSLAAAPKAAAPKPPKPVPPAVEKELRTQEKNLGDVLHTIRDYELPPGSEPATVFRAMRARRGVR